MSNTSSSLFPPLFDDPDVAGIFSDDGFVTCMLQVEAALARVEGRIGVIPAAAAAQIDAGIRGLHFDMDRLHMAMQTDGFPVIELVRQIRACAGPDASGHVHWGATTQDIMDTALILQGRAALELIEKNLGQLINGLADLARRHRHTLMAGRTHSQQALPITFGFKVANWIAPLLRHRARLAEMKPRLLVVQFGGAVGTLAALGEAGLPVQSALAEELELGVPPIPWHSQRDNLAELGGWLSLLGGGLAKIAQDVILLAQSEIGEVREAAGGKHGASSTMPQKGNPIVSEMIVAAARTNASLLAVLHNALIQEQERATAGLQMEWLALPQMFGLTAGALRKALFVCENLAVDPGRMLKNVRASNGLMLAEGLSFILARSMGRVESERLVREACRVAAQQGRHLVDVVREMTASPTDWPALRDEAEYLGATQAFIDRVLGEVES